MDTDRIRDRLRWLADTRGDEPFLTMVDTDRAGTITYAELDAAAGRFASLLRAHGTVKGSAVNLHLPNSWYLVAALMGCAEIGAVAVPTNPRSSVDDLAFITSHSACRVSITVSDRARAVIETTEMAPDIEHVFVIGDHVDDEAIDLLGILDDFEIDSGRSWSKPDDVVAVLYTSGTTGWPKGSMLTNANFAFVGEAVGNYLRLRSDDRWLVVLPMFHMNALGYQFMSGLFSGCEIVLADRWDPTTFVDLAATTSATLSSLFATHIRDVVRHAPPAPAPQSTRLRSVLYAQPVTADHRRTFEHLTGAAIRQVYGLTETIAPNLAEPMNGPTTDGTVGRPMLWSSVRIVDQTGRHVEPGQAGELEIRGVHGVSLCQGYVGETSGSASGTEVWFRTGDRFVQEDGGLYRFLGRREDLLKPAVETVSTVEVERVFQEHVAVEDVAVVGVIDSEGAEQIIAFVVPRADDHDISESELLEWARERLAAFKMPSQVVLLDSLPLTPVGKVRKAELRNVFAGRLDPRR